MKENDGVGIVDQVRRDRHDMRRSPRFSLNTSTPGGGPNDVSTTVVLEPLPAADDWLWVSKEIARPGMAVFLDIPPLAQDTNFVGGVLSHRCLDEVENKRSKGDGQDGAQLGISNADGMPADAASHLNQYNADPARATFGSYGAGWQTPSDVMHSPRTGTEIVSFPAKLRMRIIQAFNVPKSYTGGGRLFCEFHVDDNSVDIRERTRSKPASEFPVWNEKWTFVIQNSTGMISADLKHETDGQEEYVGGVVIRMSEFKDEFFGESFVDEVKLIDKAGQSSDACIQFEFELYPIVRSHFRFRGDEGIGHLVEPMNAECPDIWKVRWKDSREVGWYHTGFENVYHLRCPVRQSPEVIHHRMSLGGGKFFRRTLRSGLRDVADKDYANLDMLSKGTNEFKRSTSLLSKAAMQLEKHNSSWKASDNMSGSLLLRVVKRGVADVFTWKRKDLAPTGPSRMEEGRSGHRRSSIIGTEMLGEEGRSGHRRSSIIGTEMLGEAAANHKPYPRASSISRQRSAEPSQSRRSSSREYISSPADGDVSRSRESSRPRSERRKSRDSLSLPADAGVAGSRESSRSGRRKSRDSLSLPADAGVLGSRESSRSGRRYGGRGGGQSPFLADDVDLGRARSSSGTGSSRPKGLLTSPRHSSFERAESTVSQLLRSLGDRSST